ncbi:MAG TPA: phage baseplate assembly protein V [Allosphingosinicella sp.]|jgi:uncharacterized protein involved in type VI secretion and phage assembly
MIEGETGFFPAAARWLEGIHLARVKSIQDPDSKGRVQVQLLGPDPDGDALIWARVAVPYAGDNFGAFLIPDVDQEVVVAFPAGDTANPIVVGALWNGATALPETLGGDHVDRWTLTGKNGTRIAIVEQTSGQETVEISTPNGATATLTDDSGGQIKLVVAGNTLTMGTSGVSIQTGSKCEVQASEVSVTASNVSVSAAMSSFSGVVQCDSLITNSVVSPSYTPGAGNVW